MKAEDVCIGMEVRGGECTHYTVCNEENQKSSRYGPNHCHECREAGRYLRIKEVKDMEEETLKEICKQLKIEIVGEEDGSSYILKDGRVGVIQLRTVKIPLTQAEQRKLVSKLPKPINIRAFILTDKELLFSSYEFVENKKE